MTPKAGTVYRVATQRWTTDPIHVRSMRVTDPETLMGLIERVIGYKLEDCAFAEIHEIGLNGSITVIYGSKTQDWPKTKIINHDGVYGLKPGEVVSAAVPTKPVPVTQPKREEPKVVAASSVYANECIARYRQSYYKRAVA